MPPPFRFSLRATQRLARGLTLAAALGASTWAAAARGAQPVWIAAWSAAPQAVPDTPQTPAWRHAPALHDQTVRQILRPEANGNALRVRLSNRDGTQAVDIDGASIARSAGPLRLEADSAAPLRFGGRATLHLEPGQEAWSDPLPFAVQAGKPLVLDLYLHGATRPLTWHRLAGEAIGIARGDRVGQSGSAGFDRRITSYLWVDRLDVQTAAAPALMVAIGDSITDGMGSTLGAQRRWPDALNRRLHAAGMRDVAVLNAGISGNRLLRDSPCWGPSLQSRFARDALDLDGVRVVVVLIGINDINFAATPRRSGLDCDAPHGHPNAADLERGLTQLLKQAHARNVRVFLGTLTPAALPPAREALRQELNAWVRACRACDGVVDFDAALRDPTHPDRLLPRNDSGDHIHPSDAGYAAMAQAVDLAQLRRVLGAPAARP